MERRTKHRLLGMFVIAALVIIMLPLFQSGKEDAADTMTVNAPPFPGQIAEASIPTPTPGDIKTDPAVQTLPIHTGQEPQSAFNSQPDDTINLNQTNPPAAQQNPTTQNQAASQSNTIPIKQPADDNNNVPAVTAKNSKPAASDMVANQEDADENQDTKNNVFQNSFDTEEQNTKQLKQAKTAVKKAAPIAKNSVDKKLKVTSRKDTLDSNGLFRLKNSAWVIQLGSFKNKTNALKLVNKLRGHGYHAFIQQVADNTRVFVGPESKQEIARAIADRLEYDMHMQGLVINYKPLAI
jgi:DedD protein